VWAAFSSERRPTLNRPRFVAQVLFWAFAIAGYGGSFVAWQAVARGVDLSSFVSLVVGIGLMVFAPIVLALRLGRPPLLLLGTLAAIYYVGISLSADTYDTQRWSYSHFWDGVFLLFIQLTAAAIAVMAARSGWARPARTP
jgi:predicted tellurium resistance membrane protein TerC